jgi:hypothetical protein
VLEAREVKRFRPEGRKWRAIESAPVFRQSRKTAKTDAVLRQKDRKSETVFRLNDYIVHNIPTSFNIAFACGVTIVNRWLRYRSDAPISPSGPPYWVMINLAALGLQRLIFTGNSSFFS